MSPVLPREERDAIRARSDEWRALMADEEEPSDYDAMRTAFASAADVPALLGALDAAEEENERHALANGGCVPADAYRDLAEHVGDAWAERDAARAEVAALRQAPGLAEVLRGAIDWDFVEVFAGEPDEPSPHPTPDALTDHLADVVRAWLRGQG